MVEPVNEALPLDALDKRIINTLQTGFPLCERPYARVAQTLGTDEHVLIERLKALLERGVLSRFGPLFQAERLGGALTLCAMSIEARDFERIADAVNAHPEVAHNYAREHALNMWFVLATERAEEIDRVIEDIERETGYRVFNMPKIEEFFVGLRLEV